MLITLLLASVLLRQNSCEWVEISQRHYRKPLTPDRLNPSQTTLSKFDHHTESYEGAFTVRRKADKVDRYNRPWFEQPESTTNVNKFKSEKKSEAFTGTDNLKSKDYRNRNNANVQLVRPPHNAKIKPVYNNQSVEDITEFIGFITKVDKGDVPHGNQQLPSDEPGRLSKVTNDAFHKSYINSEHIPLLNNRRNMNKSTVGVSDHKYKLTPNRIYINHSTTESNNKETINVVSGIGTVERVKITNKKKPIASTDKFKNQFTTQTYSYNVNTDHIDSTDITTPHYNHIVALSYPKSQFVTKDEIVTEDSFSKDVEFTKTLKENVVNLDSQKSESEKSYLKDDLTTQKPIKDNNLNNDTSNIEETVNGIEPDDKHEGKPLIETAKEDNSKSIENLIKFVRVVADTISRNTQKSFKSKLRYLQELKDSIMVNIEERIEALYPDDGPRQTREARGHSHVDFPSSESALMTISFLTFAVFLIKLVLQVIHAYKNKTMMLTPILATTVGRAAAAVRHHKNQN